MGRWSFIGFRPRSVLRWSLADGGDPYALAAEHVGSLQPGADGRTRRRSPAAPWGSSATTWCARSSRSEIPGPIRLGTARHGADAVRHAGRVRPSQAHRHDPRQRRSARRARHRARLRDGRAHDRRGARRARRSGPARPSGRSRRPRDAELSVEHAAGAVRRHGRARSSSTSTPATPSRWCPLSAGRPRCPVEAFSIYRGLRAVNPSPYMYFLDFGDFQVAGASPEPLLTVSGRHVSTKPIAGTRPRGASPEEDRRIARELLGGREGARRARDARRPRPQRPRAACASTAASPSTS